VTSAFAADVFGVTAKTLSAWADEGCPKAGRGYWDLREVMRWRLERSGGNGSGDEGKNWYKNKIMWDARLKEAQCETQNLKNAVLKGEYIRIDEAQAELESFFVTLKQAVLGLPKAVGIFCSAYLSREAAREIETDLKAGLTNALSEWAGGIFTAGLDIKAAEKRAESSGTNDRQRMGRQAPRS
jgi:hypothetical protein